MKVNVCRAFASDDFELRVKGVEGASDRSWIK
jgi:hypothetical protein